MDGPQLENGYTKIANELLDALIESDLSKRQYKVALAILRKTYGYGKKVDDVTIEQLAMATNLRANHVSETVKELAGAGVIVKEAGKFGFVMGIVKNYRNWAVYPSQNGSLPKREVDPPKTGGLTSQNGTHKRKLQKITPKEEVAERFTPATMSFPLKTEKDGSTPEWFLPESKLAEWTETYPRLDVTSELRKARQWLRDNRDRRKTARGMTKCLGGWLSRAAEKAPPPSKPAGSVGSAPLWIFEEA